MEKWFSVILLMAIVVVVIIANLIRGRKNLDAPIEKKIYSYTAKSSTMTSSEAVFFKKLSSIAEGKYLVFPQLHLSAFIDSNVKGQNWKAAFRHINGKSVDYLLCDINTLQPRYAVELDDWTHDRDDRKERDIEVKRILKQAGIPLVRFSDNKLSNDEIILKFSETQS